MSEQFGAIICNTNNIPYPLYQDTKNFEEYLIIKNIVEHDYVDQTKKILLQNLDQTYMSHGLLTECFEVNKKIITALTACTGYPTGK